MRGSESGRPQGVGTHEAQLKLVRASVAQWHWGPLFNNIGNVTNAVAHCAFTPVLGAGCSRIGVGESDAYRAIGAEAAAVLHDQRLDDHARRYLVSLMRTLGVEILPQGSETLPVDPHLHEVRIHFTRLASSASRLFGGAISSEPRPVDALVSHAIEALSPSAFAATRLAVLDAIDAVASLDHDLPEWQLFGQHGMLRQLVALSEDFVSGWVPTDLEERGLLDHRQALARRLVDLVRPRPPGGIRLGIEQLEWLDRLVWHAFRYAATVYPSSIELAFQLSVCCAQQPPSAITPPLPVATIAAVDHDPLPTLQGLLRRCRSADGASHGEWALFHDAVAFTLSRMYEVWKADPLGTPAPIALSTNYDLELEDALVRSRVPFEVVIPVVLISDGFDELRWLRASVPVGRDVLDTQWGWWPKSQWGQDLEGPLVIKLHGSPLHDITHNIRNLELEEGNQLAHGSVLTEFDYLRTMVNTANGLPEWVSSQVSRDDRVLMFLGQSVSDWNIRLRIFHSMYVRMLKATDNENSMPVGGERRQARNGEAREASRYDGPRYVAINRNFDPIRSAALGMLGVHVYQGELEHLIDPLRRATPLPVGRRT